MSAILKQKLIDIANGFTKYGLWKGGGSGGSSALSEMNDVSFTNLQANNILKYNGNVWVNDDNLHEYSTEEKVVGKWIDGKEIYEKVYKVSITDRNWHDLYTDINVDTIIKLKGILYYGNSHPYFMELQGNTYPSNTSRAFALYNKNENYISYISSYNELDLSSSYIFFILQYTKN